MKQAALDVEAGLVGGIVGPGQIDRRGPRGRRGQPGDRGGRAQIHDRSHVARRRETVGVLRSDPEIVARAGGKTGHRDPGGAGRGLGCEHRPTPAGRVPVLRHETGLVRRLVGPGQGDAGGTRRGRHQPARAGRRHRYRHDVARRREPVRLMDGPDPEVVDRARLKVPQLGRGRVGPDGLEDRPGSALHPGSPTLDHETGLVRRLVDEADGRAGRVRSRDARAGRRRRRHRDRHDLAVLPSFLPRVHDARADAELVGRARLETRHRRRLAVLREVGIDLRPVGLDLGPVADREEGLLLRPIGPGKLDGGRAVRDRGEISRIL